jgi:putative ABC transport system substrate-binding protein
MEKRILFTALVLGVMGLSLPTVSVNGQTASPPKVYKVCLTQIATHPDLDSSRRGTMDGLVEKGFVAGKNISYIIRNAEGDMTAAASIADYFVSLRPDLIISITTSSSQAMVGAARGTQIPIVFHTVTDPVTAGLVPSWQKAAPYVTGVSDWADVPTQINFILSIAPKIKNLGIVYNAGEVNSVVQVKELRNEVGPKLALKVVEATAATTADVYAAAMSLVGKVDAMWIPTDNTASSAIDSIVKVAEEHKIPFFGSTTSHVVDGGCCAGAGVDYYWIGKQAAYMAASILNEGRSKSG